MMKVRIDGEWGRCGKCGHKLFRMVSDDIKAVGTIEIKCHSCKELNTTKMIIEEKEQNWIFTFGSGQPNAGYYVKIRGKYGEARRRMFATFGENWSFQYSEEEFKKYLEDGTATEKPLRECDAI